MGYMVVPAVVWGYDLLSGGRAQPQGSEARRSGRVSRRACPATTFFLFNITREHQTTYGTLQYYGTTVLKAAKIYLHSRSITWQS